MALSHTGSGGGDLASFATLHTVVLGAFTVDVANLKLQLVSLVLL